MKHNYVLLPTPEGRDARATIARALAPAAAVIGPATFDERPAFTKWPCCGERVGAAGPMSNTGDLQ